jgi:hypothetical protein
MGRMGEMGGMGETYKKSRFFTFMVIYLTIKITSGPLPLARGGLGWGPPSLQNTTFDTWIRDETLIR